MTETLLALLIVLPGLVIAIVCHEVAHGFVALLLGDPTARERRRLSLNPLRHLDPIGTVLLPGVLALTGAPVFGWAKPVPIDKWRLRNPRWGMMAVAAAGPLSNLLLAALAAIVLGLIAASVTIAPQGVFLGLVTGVQFFLLINIFLALFNLLPVPPFDGSHIVEGLLPARAAHVYARLRPFGLPILFALLLVVPWLFPGLGIIENLVLPPVEWVRMRYVELAAWVAGI